MNKDDFLFALREQFTASIEEVYAECEHDHGVDFKTLGTKLAKLKKAAKLQGLSESDFDELVKNGLPHAWETLHGGKKAA